MNMADEHFEKNLCMIQLITGDGKADAVDGPAQIVSLIDGILRLFSSIYSDIESDRVVGKTPIVGAASSAPLIFPVGIKCKEVFDQQVIHLND